MTKIDTGLIDQFIQEYMANGHVSGVGLGITQSGSVLYEQGYGVANQSTLAPVTAHTQFEMASCTKTYTAWGVLWLQDQGQLSIADEVGQYLSLEAGPEFEPVAIDRFLSMSSGLSDGSSNTLSWRFVLDEALRRGPQSTPGTVALYSNPSFMMMGWLIEAVSGTPYVQFMNATMLGAEGLNLPDTVVHQDGVTPADLAVGYTWTQKGGFVQASTRRPSSSFSSGAMLSSAAGLAQYMTALDQQLVLSPSAYEQLFTQVPFDGGNPGPWALGWEHQEVNGRPSWTKGGGLPGYNSFLLRDIGSGASVVLATNGTGVGASAAAEAVMQIVLAEAQPMRLS